jgi:hypothetical protein
MKKKLLIVFFALLFAPLFSHAQGLGSITGRVTDTNSGAVAGATVTATQIDTGFIRSATTDADGLYVIPSLRPATYTLSVEAEGFSSSRQTGIVLQADQTLTVNVTVSVGSTTETVTVVGNALQVDTSTSTLRQVIEQQRISELPLNGRNAAQLTLLVAGAVNSPNGGADQGATKTFPGAVTFSANGSRQNSISYQLDGGNYVDEYTNVNQPFPFPDALQEFSVQTSNYSAEYGSNAGGVVNVVTKSGTNNFHGDAFAFNRNPAFNAQNFFATPTTPDQIKRNQFGGVFGGPIRKDKSFFFGGYQRTEFRNLVLGSQKVVGQTDVSHFLAAGPFLDPANPTGPHLPGTIDPAVATMLGIIPGCDVVGCVAFNANAGQADPNAKFSLVGSIPAGSNPTVPFSKPDIENFDSAIGRIDHSFRQSDKLTGRYEFDRFTKAAVFNPMQLASYTDATFSIIAQNFLAHETHIFSPRLINDFRFSYSREVSHRGPGANAVDVTAFGVNIPFQPNPSGMQGVGVQGGFTFGDNPPAFFTRNNYTWANDISWERGKHDLHFGGSFERSLVDLNNFFNQPGIFGFGNADDYLSSPAIQAVPTGSIPGTYQLFLAGILSDGAGVGNGFGLQQGAGEFKNNRANFVGVYFQDNYRINRRLTLNLGLRYEPAFPWSDTGNRWAQVNLAAMAAGTVSRVYPNAPPGIFFSGQNGIASDPGMPENALRTNWKGFAPRLGFAYDMFGDGKTSLRGGAGIFYDTRVMGMLSNRFVDEWPFSPQFILSTAGGSSPTASSAPGSFSDPLCTQTATQATLHCDGGQMINYPTFPSPFPAPTNFAYIPPFNEIAVSYDPSGDYHVPTTYEWNLAIERQLPANLLFRVAYVGSRTLHILETEYYNPSTPNGIAGCPKSAGSPGKAGTGLANCTVFLGSGGAFLTNTFSSTVQADITDVNASYHALQTTIEKHMSHGFTFLANYTFSKSLDDLPFGEGVSGFDTAYSPLPFNDPNRHAMDYGPSGFDHTHVFTGSYVWHSPAIRNSSTFLRYLLNDYEIGGIVSAASGRPITVLQGTELSSTGISQDRGTFISGVDPYSSDSCTGVTAKCVSWLNPAAFKTTAALKANCAAKFTPACPLPTFGNVGKNVLRLPTTSNWDVQVSKYFAFTERWKLQLRAEYFNVLNHPNFAPESISTGTVNGTDQISAFDKLNGNSAFGTFRAGQAGDPRVAQLAAKLFF